MRCERAKTSLFLSDSIKKSLRLLKNLYNFIFCDRNYVFKRYPEYSEIQRCKYSLLHVYGIPITSLSNFFISEILTFLLSFSLSVSCVTKFTKSAK